MRARSLVRRGPACFRGLSGGVRRRPVDVRGADTGSAADVFQYPAAHLRERPIRRVAPRARPVTRTRDERRRASLNLRHETAYAALVSVRSAPAGGADAGGAG